MNPVPGEHGGRTRRLFNPRVSFLAHFVGVLENGWLELDIVVSALGCLLRVDRKIALLIEQVLRHAK